MNIRNIGIVAHIDAGKTTITENLLFRSGSIRSLGSVDKGTAHTDSLEVEKQRGISVKAAEAVLVWKNTELHIIDTPGHADFSAEVERSLSVLDGAVLVISAVEGVQPQTEVYFEALKAMNIPTIIFINKIDRIGADTDKVQEQISERLTKGFLPLQILSGNKICSKTEVPDQEIIEALCDLDEEIMEKYLNEEELSAKYLSLKLADLCKAGKVYPVLYGAALKGVGIHELLDAMVDYLPSPKKNDDNTLSGLVFKIDYDKLFGKVAFVRLYSGKLAAREMIHNYTKDIDEKITQVRKLGPQKLMDTGCAEAGEIACAAGLTGASVGDVLGSPLYIPKVPNIAVPLLSFQVIPETEADINSMVEAFLRLEEEDPMLHVQWIKEKRELHVQLMGMIQVEILQSILKERFDLKVSFEKPSVIYKETPKAKGIGFEAYTMPKPCWAIVKFELEPLERGAGLIFESKVRTEHIKIKYQKEVEKQLPKVLEQGMFGWQVIDLKVTLAEGEDHFMHSRPGDFAAATSMAVMNGLAAVGTELLEPMLKFKITASEELAGKLLGDIVQMRGTFDSPVISKGNITIEGEYPVSSSLEYPVRLGILSGGRAVLNTKFNGYKPCPRELGAERERIGVNPLDRDKFILSVRNAL